MATYGQIKKGAKGEAVSRLQELLNQNGYSLDADGIFGSKTQAAVRDYQQKSGLAVDGIVGENTWGSLNGRGGGGSGSSQSTSSTADWLASYEGNRPSYQQSQAVQDALDQLKNQEHNKPGGYQSSYSEQIQQLLDQIMNREDFKYDFAADPMYQQYAQRYQQQGKLAMMDTMGQAAALTGGYNNSYAQSVGQQAYQGYLQGLNDVIPQLRDAAYQAYRGEGEDMYNQLGTLKGMEDSEYGKYRDTVGDYYNDLNHYYNKYNDMSQQDYNRYLNDASAWEAERAYWYGKQQDEQAQSNWEQEFELAKQQALKGSGGSGGKSGPAPGSYDDLLALANKFGLTYDMIYDAQLAGTINSYQANALAARVDAYVGTYGDGGSPAPDLYKEFVAVTGKPGVLTASEFESRKNAGSSSVAKYYTYQDYLDAMRVKIEEEKKKEEDKSQK